MKPVIHSTSGLTSPTSQQVILVTTPSRWATSSTSRTPCSAGWGGSWLAIRVGTGGEELKKGTIPNRKKAESLASSQQETTNSRDTLPNKGRGSLFKRKSARRAKSLGKDHWEEVIFSGLATKFPPYERVVLRDPAFVRPVVVFGAIADVARDMLLKEFPDRFESPQMEKGAENDPKKGKTGIIRFGAIREAIDRKKHCVLDVTPYHVDRLNYAQYYPIVIFLKGESKQAIKDVRSRWRGSAGSHKNPKKLQEMNDRMDTLYTHLFTGVITHTTTDVWFPKLVELIQAQQRRPVWMSEKKANEDFNDDFMFPMPNRLSIAAAPDHELDLARPADDLDISPMQRKRLVRSSSDPSINTADRVPGIPPYPAPPGYQKQSPYDQGREEWDDYRHPGSPHDRDGDWQMHPDGYYPDPHHPHHPPPESWSPHYQSSQPPPPHHPPYGGQSRSSIDVYATITPSERARKRMPDSDYPSPRDDYGPRDRLPPDDLYQRSGPRPPHDPHMSPSQPPVDHRGYNDGSSNDNDSYSRYVSSPANKHDDSKLRDKFSSLQVVGGGRERSPGSHDPYRFTRSTANPVASANIDRVKLSNLTARYRQENRQGKASSGKGGGPMSPSSVPSGSEPGPSAGKKKEPPPVPAKTYSLKEVGFDPEEMKARNYENSNRSYNYSEVHFPSQQPPLPPPPAGGSDPRYPHHDSPLPPQAPPHGSMDSPYEYISTRALNANTRPARRGDPVPPEIPPPPRDDYSYEGGPNPNPRAFSNSVYMDQREVERARHGGEHGDGDPGGYTRPRTDDEQLRDLQVQRQHRSRLKSEPLLVDRSKSETRLDDERPGASRWSKYRSWDMGKEGPRPFDAYKKLITPGFYGSRKNMSKSHDELREESSQGQASRWPPGAGSPTHVAEGGSAFESYRKVTSSSSLPPNGRVRPASDDHHTTRRRHLTEGSPLSLPLLPPSSSRPAFTEMAAIPSQPLAPPPLPLAAVLTAFPGPKTNDSPEGAHGSSNRGPVRRHLSAVESRSPALETRGFSSGEVTRNKRSSADMERRRVAGRNAGNNSDVGGWTRRGEEKQWLGGGEHNVPGAGKDVGKRKTGSVSSVNAWPGQSLMVDTSSGSSGSMQPLRSDTHSAGITPLSPPAHDEHGKSSVGNGLLMERPVPHSVFTKPTTEKVSDSMTTSPELPLPPPHPSDNKVHNVKVSGANLSELQLLPPPPNCEVRKVKVSEKVSELPLPPPTPSDTELRKVKVSEKTLSELPLPPPPPPDNAEPIKRVAGDEATSPDLPLPPPPPSLLVTHDAHKCSPAPPKAPPLLKVTPPPPPPPPPLVVTPLPLVNGGEGEGVGRGKPPLRRLSGPSHAAGDGDEMTGEESGDGETWESVSTPDTVVAAGPSGKEAEEGQTVVATARGVFTSAGGVLKSEETGVSIVIPEGALEEGSSQEIYFKVCSGSSILPPLDEDKGETLLSPLVMCGPHGLQFRKPVELHLPHSASLNPHSWSFALKSSDSPSGQPTQWQNMNLAGSEGVAQGHVNQSSVSVLVDHF
ncbi:tight junction protein ZO-1-like isoform X2 [Babylonia areolata]|uniref:tight junction protein ZO-1-like isoform X2 n=1 Tax=Babylonia areolata TaxID=304850 RepID=UPI003FD20CB6